MRCRHDEEVRDLRECERTHPKGYMEGDWPRFVRSLTQHQRDAVLRRLPVTKGRQG